MLFFVKDLILFFNIKVSIVATFIFFCKNDVEFPTSLRVYKKNHVPKKLNIHVTTTSPSGTPRDDACSAGHGVQCFDACEHDFGCAARTHDGVSSLPRPKIDLRVHLEFGSLCVRVCDLARRGEQAPFEPSGIPELVGRHGVHFDVDHARVWTRHAQMARNSQAVLRVLHFRPFFGCHDDRFIERFTSQLKKNKRGGCPSVSSGRHANSFGIILRQLSFECAKALAARRLN